MNRTKRNIITGVIIAVFSIGLLSVFAYRKALDISTPFPPVKKTERERAGNAGKPVVYFGVISRYPPNIIYQGYQPLMDYLSEQTPYRFVLKLSTSYQETVKQLVEGKVAAAFLGSFIYAKTRRKYGIKCILKPLNENFKPFFHSVLITRSKSLIYSFEDLKGKKLALPSDQSFSGNWLPLYELKKYGLSVQDLDSLHHFAHHHTVVYQVLKGNFDAGVVKDRVAKEYLDRGIRIFGYSDPIPGSPIVVPRNYNPEVVDAIRSALLKIDVHQPKYQKLVKNWDKEFAYGFTEASDSDYQSIQEILKNAGAN